MKKVFIVTCTGDRPEAFSLLCVYLERQTVFKKNYPYHFIWVVVDDGKQKYDKTAVTSVIEKTKKLTSVVYLKKPSDKNTLQENLITALSEATEDDIVIFMEDDDWYRKDYIEKTFSFFTQGAHIVGVNRVLYYNVANRTYKRHVNMHHANLGSTGITGRIITDLKQLLHEIDYTQMPNFIDQHLWALPGCQQILYRDDTMVSIKGMPGRPGYENVHRKKMPNTDKRLDLLRSIITEDTDFYIKVK